MSNDLQQEMVWPSALGDVQILSFCTPEQIRSFSFDNRFGKYAHYRSLYTKRESLELEAKSEDANVVIALAGGRNIVGFGILAYPDPGERWTKVGSRVMIEVKALEVLRKWRPTRVSRGIVRMILSHPQIDNKIAYLIGYSWTWDLDGTHKSAQEYRRMLIKLMDPYGFQEYQTNEPNISLRPENIFMARIGHHVSEEMKKRFKWVRFGIYTDIPG